MENGSVLFMKCNVAQMSRSASKLKVIKKSVILRYKALLDVLY